MNRRRFAFLSFAAVAAAPLAARAQTEMDDPFKGPLPTLQQTGGIHYSLGPDLDPRVIDIGKDLGCVCGTCPHEPVSTCTCGTAERMRATIALGLAQNKDKGSIVDMVTERFGEGAVPKPPFSGINLIAWLGPFAAIAVAVFWLRGKLKSWQHVPAGAGASAGAPAGGGGAGSAADPYMAALEKELASRERI